ACLPRLGSRRINARLGKMTDGTSTSRSARRQALRLLAGGLTAGGFWPAWQLVTPQAGASGPTPWTYSGAQGPAPWSQLAPAYQACGRGRRQSPIDLAAAHLGQAADLAIDWHPSPARLINTGHTLELNPVGNGAKSGLTLGGRRFTFQQVHFHHPSEHAL